MSSMRTPPIVESYLIRMPIIALLLMTAGAGAQTETVQRIPPEYPATSGPLAW